MTTPTPGDSAGAAESISGITVSAPAEDAAGASEALGVAITQAASPVLDQAAAADSMSVIQIPPPAPTPAAKSYAVASPAFIRSAMPRMHVQNLITKQWLHRDVKGIAQPQITWNLNQPDTFTCTLKPPRKDMMTSAGEPLLEEWRDAIYLEENDTIRWGGILTGSTFSGPEWGISATGFAGYPTGLPFEGNLLYYGADALDVVRAIWAWVQAQPRGNIGMQLDTVKSGVLLGNTVSNLARTVLTRPTTKADKFKAISTLGSALAFGIAKDSIVQKVWVQDSSQFSAGMDINIGEREVTRILRVVTNSNNLPTGEIITVSLKYDYPTGSDFQQVQSYAKITRNEGAGVDHIFVSNPQAFPSGSAIIINGNRVYTVQQVFTDAATGIPTGELLLTPALTAFVLAGDIVRQAPTPFRLDWWNSTDCGQEISAIQAEAIFDWREYHTWNGPAKTDVAHHLTFGVPRVGTRKTHLRFAENENIVQPVHVARDGTQFADTVIGLGAGQGRSQIRATVSDLGDRLRRVHVYADQTVTTTARMSSRAVQALFAVVRLDNPAQVVVKNHPNAPFGSFGPGDDIYVQLNSGWRKTGIWCRITSMTQDPTTSLMTLTVARSDSFTYMAQSGQAGTI